MKKIQHINEECRKPDYPEFGDLYLKEGSKSKTGSALFPKMTSQLSIHVKKWGVNFWLGRSKGLKTSEKGKNLATDLPESTVVSRRTTGHFLMFFAWRMRRRISWGWGGWNVGLWTGLHAVVVVAKYGERSHRFVLGNFFLLHILFVIFWQNNLNQTQNVFKEI